MHFTLEIFDEQKSYFGFLILYLKEKKQIIIVEYNIHIGIIIVKYNMHIGRKTKLKILIRNEP